MARIFRRTATIGLATALLSMSIGVAPAYAGAESQFVNKINNARAAAGKAPVETYWDLTDDARAHSKRMAEEQNLYHSPNLGSVTTGWKALGENVGVGGSVNQLFDAFMGSSAHRANILGSYNYVGVGVKVDANDVMWVTMIFMLHPDDLNGTGDTTTTTTTTQPPSTTTTTQPPSTTTTTQPPSTTTTTQPPSTTTTTTLAPSDEPTVVPFEVTQEEFEVLGEGWVPMSLFRLLGSIGR